MLSTPRLAPSSSRTTRVIGQLQESLESIQREVENTRAQLQTVRDSKEASEKENEDNIESNKQIRQDIQQVLDMLESKQQLLDSTKMTSVSTENRVKQLKDEAALARKELDDLKRRENTIEKERLAIEQAKEKQAQQQKTFENTVAQTQTEFDKEIEQLEAQVVSLQEHIQNVKQKDVQKDAQALMEKQVKERQAIINTFESIQKEIELNNQNFIIQVKQELVELVNQLSTEEDELSLKVDNCKNDVHTLVSKIKSNAEE